MSEGVNPVQELSGGSVTANLLTGPNVDEYFQRTVSTSTSDFLTDALGSTLALADTSGTVQTEYTYSPFGTTTAQGTGSANSFQFTGRENDEDGLYYYRARYYSPMIGRFVSEDPLGYAGRHADLYEYGADSPGEFVDPSGRELVATLVGVVGGTFGAVDQGIQAYNCGERGFALAGAITRGFVAGGVGAVAGLYFTALGGPIYGPYLGGGVGGATYNWLNDALQGRPSGWRTGADVLRGAAMGTALGGFADNIVSKGPGGWNFNPFRSPRTFGPKALEEYTRDIAAGATGLAVPTTANAMAGVSCGCQ